jgi:hypothetical protein
VGVVPGPRGHVRPDRTTPAGSAARTSPTPPGTPPVPPTGPAPARSVRTPGHRAGAASCVRGVLHERGGRGRPAWPGHPGSRAAGVPVQERVGADEPVPCHMLGFLRGDLRPHPASSSSSRRRKSGPGSGRPPGPSGSAASVPGAGQRPTSVGPNPAFRWRVTSGMLIRTVPPCAPATVGILMPPKTHQRCNLGAPIVWVRRPAGVGYSDRSDGSGCCRVAWTTARLHRPSDSTPGRAQGGGPLSRYLFSRRGSP